MKRRIIVVLVVIVVAAAGFFVFRNNQRQQAAVSNNFQTVKIARGSLTATVGATGTVRANQTAVINWLTTGTVDKVYVKLGDKVTAHQILADLRKDSLPQNLITAETDLVTAQRNLDDLKNSDASKAKALQTLADAQKALDDAQKKADSKSYTRASQDIIDVAYANYILAQNTVDQKQQVYDGTTYLAEDNANRAAALSDLAAAKQRRDTALANYNQAKSRPDTLDVNIADANLEMAKANLKDAQRGWDRVKNGADPNDIAAAQARVDAVKATLALESINAPFNGIVTDININPGDSVAPSSGATTGAIRIDDLSRFLVDVQVTEVDINRVKVGQPVSLSFDAITDKQYNGKVTEVGRVGTTVQGVVNFTVTVELTNADPAVLPGMTAAVNIVVNQLNDALLVPNRAVRLQNSQRVVYVLRDGKAVPVNIQLGATSDANSEIVSGDVKEGDLAVLNPPAAGIQPGGGPRFGGPGGN